MYDPAYYDITEQRRRAGENPIYGTPAPDPEREEKPKLKTLAQFEEKAPEWIIPGYIPKKQITLICGTGGTGKTSFWISLVSSISAGSRTLFDGSGEITPDYIPHTVMFFSGEDSIETVLKKKLREQGADMEMITALDITDPDFEKIKFNSDLLRNLIKEYQPYLCVMDPLQSFIDSKIKMADRNAMRQAMRNLIELGETYGTTFIIVMHTNKQSNVYGRQRMADSADLWDIARSVLMIGEADENGLKYLSHEKSNYGRTGKTLLFRNDNGNPTFWDWTDKKDRDFVLEAAEKRNNQRNPERKNEIVNIIMSELERNPEGIPAQDINKLLSDLGYGQNIIKEVKAGLKESGRIKYIKPNMIDNWIIKKG